MPQPLLPCCTPLCSQVLQVLEQLIKLDNGLLGSDLKELPQSSHAASFLEDLGRRLALDPRPSETIR